MQHLWRTSKGNPGVLQLGCGFGCGAGTQWEPHTPQPEEAAQNHLQGPHQVDLTWDFFKHAEGN